jgi:hypothetical protein
MHHDALRDEEYLGGLVESERLAPAIKAVFERGWESSFRRLVDSHVARKNEEIERLCHAHYGEFISAIDSLVTVKLDVIELTRSITELTDAVQTSGDDLVDVSEHLLECRYVCRHLDRAQEVTNRLEALVVLLARAQQQIGARHFFDALRTLDALEGTHFPRYMQYAIVRQLAARLPWMRRQVRDEVRADFARWLRAVEVQVIAVGAKALHQTDRRLHTEEMRRLRKMRRQRRIMRREAEAALQAAAWAASAARAPVRRPSSMR